MTIGYFLGTERVGLLAFAPDGAAIGGPSFWEGSATETVVHTATGQEITIPGDIHPDHIKLMVAGDIPWPEGTMETEWVDDLPPYCSHEDSRGGRCIRAGADGRY